MNRSTGTRSPPVQKSSLRGSSYRCSLRGAAVDDNPVATAFDNKALQDDALAANVEDGARRARSSEPRSAAAVERDALLLITNDNVLCAVSGNADGIARERLVGGGL